MPTLSICDADPPFRDRERDPRERVAGAGALLAEAVVEPEHGVMRDAVDARVIVQEEPVRIDVERSAEVRALVQVAPDALAASHDQQAEGLAPLAPDELPRLAVGHVVEGADRSPWRGREFPLAPEVCRRTHLRIRPGTA